MSAHDTAQKMLSLLRPHCQRIEIAGSLRRGKADPKDIELVGVGGKDLLARTDALVRDGIISKAQYGASKTTRWGDKYRGFDFDGWRVELFVATPENFGATFWLRTGPGDANKLVMQYLLNSPLRLSEGYWTWNGKRLHTPDERNVFELLNMPFLQPAERTEAAYRAHLKRGHTLGDPAPFLPADTSAPKLFDDGGGAHGPERGHRTAAQVAAEQAYKAQFENAVSRVAYGCYHGTPIKRIVWMTWENGRVVDRWEPNKAAAERYLAQNCPPEKDEEAPADGI